MTESTTSNQLPRFGHYISTQHRLNFGYRYHCRCGTVGKYKKTAALTTRGAIAHLRAHKVAAQERLKEAT